MAPGNDGRWHAALAGMPRAWAGLLNDREMQRRSESKFLMPQEAALRLASALRPACAVLPAGDALIASYQSLYFDTDDLSLFHAHRRGRRVRHKVRIRHYPDRQVSFLEVKLRRGEHDSLKVRRERDFGDSRLSHADRAFLDAQCGRHDDLRPQAWITYSRITLLALRSTERVTIDLHFAAYRAHARAELPHLAVVEVKQPRFDRRGVALRAVLDAGCRPGWASKYCTGVILTSPNVRANRLREHLRALQAVRSWAH